jgi:hypothetical protein
MPLIFGEVGMKAVTIRGVEPEVAQKLKITAKEKGLSVNQLIIDLIKTNLGLKKEKEFSREYDDLDDLFGRWSDDEFEEINSTVTHGRKIDPELWQ